MFKLINNIKEWCRRCVCRKLIILKNSIVIISELRSIMLIMIKLNLLTKKTLLKTKIKDRYIIVINKLIFTVKLKLFI